jgi:hypothetical protein
LPLEEDFAGKVLAVDSVGKMPEVVVKPVLLPSVGSITWAFEEIAIVVVEKLEVELLASETS